MQPILKENKMLIKRFIIVGCFLISTNLYAEAITDGTLGRVESLSGYFTIPDNLGQQKGGNLFHSFETFNINTGESATFTGPSSVENIISRVTGRSESFIDGTLSSKIDGANLYLLNPSGILFGKNASLDITGSFHASTADVLHLEDGGRFDVTNPSNSLLTVAQPAAFGFLGNDPGAITLEGTRIVVEAPPELEGPERDEGRGVDEGKTLSLIGGDLLIKDSTLLAPNGRINLVSVASKGQVVVTSGELLTNSFEKRGKITLSQSAWPTPEELEMYGPPPANLDVSAKKGAGQVFIRAGQFISNNAWIFADTAGYKNGLIDIVVDEEMRLTNSTKITVGNFGMSQESGLITLTTNGSLFVGLTQEEFENILDKEGIPPSAIPEVVKDSTFKEYFFSTIGTGNFDSGTGGDIQITTPKLEVSYGLIEAFTEGPGNAGNIQINAQEVNLQNYGSINAATGYNSEMSDFIESSSGQAGNITINATDKIALSDFSSITVGADNDTTGDAGNIDLNTPHLTLNSAQITAYNAGEGDAGSIDITTDTALLTGKSSIYTEAKNAGGGNIRMNVRDNLLMADDSWITAEAFGDKPENKGGNIEISNPALFRLDNSQLRANAHAGNGGNIDINTEQFNVSGESRIDVSSELGLNGELILNSTKLKDEFLVLSPPTFHDIALSLNRCEGLANNLSSLYLISRDTSPQSPGDLKSHPFVASDETD